MFLVKFNCRKCNRSFIKNRFNADFSEFIFYKKMVYIVFVNITINFKKLKPKDSEKLVSF